MANFRESFEKTMGNEGYYSDHENDSGGETYMGIARNFHPDWRGWDFIDQMKREGKRIGHTDPLYNLAMTFYRNHFWNRVRGDEIRDQDVANKIFDIAVNMGVQRSILFLQKALNILNKNTELYADITEDGAIGPNTIYTLNRHLDLKGNEVLLKTIALYQGNHYIKYATKNKSKQVFMYGWVKRAFEI